MRWWRTTKVDRWIVRRRGSFSAELGAGNTQCARSSRVPVFRSWIKYNFSAPASAKGHSECYLSPSSLSETAFLPHSTIYALCTRDSALELCRRSHRGEERQELHCPFRDHGRTLKRRLRNKPGPPREGGGTPGYTHLSGSYVVSGHLVDI
jgi:hypothetical protein